jgi:hypothetical protein
VTPDAAALDDRRRHVWRCSDDARRRDDVMAATAGPAHRFLLVEVSGPWGRSALLDSRLDRYHAGRLADAADAAGVRVLVIRRPGRTPQRRSWGEVPRSAVALVDVSAQGRAVGWHSWSLPHELLDIDLYGRVEPNGRQDVALVCTHGRHDLCCAVRGRPVASALAAASPWDVWECSHLGGDRFAANVLLLPTGDLFGGLDEKTAPAVAAAHREGRVVAEHYRGRFGTAPAAQAAVQHLLEHAGTQVREDVVVQRVERLPDEDAQRWQVDAAVREGSVGSGRDSGRGSGRGPGQGDHVHYRLRVSARWSEPVVLTCAAAGPGRVRLLTVDEVHRIDG